MIDKFYNYMFLGKILEKIKNNEKINNSEVFWGLFGR